MDLSETHIPGAKQTILVHRDSSYKRLPGTVGIDGTGLRAIGACTDIYPLLPHNRIVYISVSAHNKESWPPAEPKV